MPLTQPRGAFRNHNGVRHAMSSPKSKDRRAVAQRPNIALGAAIISLFVATLAILVLLVLGFSFPSAVLLGWGVHAAVFLVTVAWGVYQHRSGAPIEEDRFNRQDDSGKPNSLRHDSCDDHGQNPLQIFLVTSDGSHEHDLVNSLGRHGHLVHHASDYEAGLDWIRDTPDRINLLIFDMDLPPDIQAGVDALLAFRAQCAEIPVLLLSGSVQRDEFSDHRRAIGDVTLRKPVSRERLMEGMTAVRENFSARR